MDAIGPITFVKLDQLPQRAQRQWELAARSGVDGIALWDTGVRGEAFDVTGEAVALTYAEGRQFLESYQILLDFTPIPVRYGTVELRQRFKVLKVEVLQVKRVIAAYIGGDPNVYTALVFSRWKLLPMDPFVLKP